nr:MAG TPA: hypothetical protein [Caudoviricetes sp.]
MTISGRWAECLPPLISLKNTFYYFFPFAIIET